ncbi:MAG: hypothetical protein KUG78_17120 [Kangiellaceae bacterium]|nr:hypothetical protein [Kangiellaceae bacterium]
MNKHTLKFWAVLDFAYIGYYLIGTIISGHIPFVWEINSAVSISTSYGHDSPLYMTLASLTLLISTIWSGVVLFKEKLNWSWLIYVQFPFRIFLVMPSVFFISLFLPESGGITQASIVELLIIGIESFKVYTVYKSKRELNKTLQNIQAKAPEFMK